MGYTARIDAFHGRNPVATAWPAGGRLHRYDSSPTTDRASTYVPVPKAGVSNNSWRTYLKLNILTHSPASVLSNLRFFFDGGAWDTGVQVYVALHEVYSPASRADNGAIITGGVLASTLTAASPLVVMAGNLLTGVNTGYGAQFYVVLQAVVSSAAAQGISTPRTFTYRLDEA